jgi:hypothetical protein
MHWFPADLRRRSGWQGLAPARPGDASQQGLMARSEGEQGTDHIPEGGIARLKSLKPALVAPGAPETRVPQIFYPV